MSCRSILSKSGQVGVEIDHVGRIYLNGNAIFDQNHDFSDTLYFF